MTDMSHESAHTETALPGALPYDQALERMIRVDHAGEFGAVQIYKGQLAVLKGSASEDTIQHMYDQECAHLETFENLLVERGVRPTVLSPLWKRAGFALGAVTALMGPKAAMACTAAVEEVIDQHYADQRDRLGPQDAELSGIIEKFRLEELEHRDTALEQGAEDAVGYPVLRRAIRAGSRLAIALSERF